jgi:hypothetical protein
MGSLWRLTYIISRSPIEHVHLQIVTPRLVEKFTPCTQWIFLSIDWRFWLK